MSNANAILVNHPGPLPIKLKYTPQSNLKETIAFSGSIFSNDIASENIGFELKVNGETIGKSTIYANDTRGVHHATTPTMVNYNLPIVFKDKKILPVTIELVSVNVDSKSDKNDFFNVTIFE
jgi:hypothetical protein